MKFIWKATVVVAASASLGCHLPADLPSTEDVRIVEPQVTATNTLAQAFAAGLKSDDVRHRLVADFRRSPYSEHKLVVAAYLRTPGGVMLLAAARQAGFDTDALVARVDELPSLQLYLPIADHRSTWTGEPHLLVAPNLSDGPPTIGYGPTEPTNGREIRDGRDVGALLVIQRAEPMFRRLVADADYTGPAIQPMGQDQFGGYFEERDPQGNVVQAYELADRVKGPLRLEDPGGGGSTPATKVTSIYNYGVCDQVCVGETLEFEFESTQGGSTQTLRITGVPSSGGYNPPTGSNKVSNFVTSAGSILIGVREDDGFGFPNPDDPFFCNFWGTGCTVNTSPLMPQGVTYRDFHLCEDGVNTGTNNCLSARPVDISMTFQVQ